jgi:hypothetical protein
MAKFQVPTIGGLRKVIKPASATAAGTTIAGIGSGTVTLAQLAALITNQQTTQTNNGGGNIGGGSGGSITLGPGLAGGGPLVGNVNVRLTTPLALISEEGPPGDDGMPGAPGLQGPAGAPGARGLMGIPGASWFDDYPVADDLLAVCPAPIGPLGMFSNGISVGTPLGDGANITAPSGNTSLKITGSPASVAHPVAGNIRIATNPSLTGAGGTLTLAAGAAAGGSFAGGTFLITAGAGSGSGLGGYLIQSGGAGGSTGVGGGFSLAGGPGGLTAGDGGEVDITGGSSNAVGDGGPITFSGGSTPSGMGGSINLFPGTGTFVAGNSNDGITLIVNAQDTGGITIDQNANLIFGFQNGNPAGAGTYGALVDQGYYYVTATGTITVPAYSGSLVVNAGSQLSLIIKFPSSPVDGQLFEISFMSAVTATLTLEDSGGTAANVLGAPATVLANSGYSWRYILALTKWVRRF